VWDRWPTTPLTGPTLIRLRGSATRFVFFSPLRLFCFLLIKSGPQTLSRFQKYYVNIEPLHEVNTSEFKTPESFLAGVPKTHKHYRTLVEVYTLVDRNPWYNDSQKVNLLRKISEKGLQPA